MEIISKRKNLFFFLLAFISISPELLIYFQSGGLSKELLYDGDESFYLGLPRAVMNGNYPDYYYANTEQKGILEMALSSPNSITDVIVGLTMAKICSSPVVLGLVLDFFCIWFVLILAYPLFSLFFEDKIISLFATLVFTFSPFLYSIVLGVLAENLGFLSSEHFRFFGYYTNMSFPIKRAIYTQLSLVLSVFALVYFFSNAFTDNKKKVMFSAMFIGILVYVYPFNWIFVVITVGIYSFFKITSEKSIKRFFCFGANFFIPLILVSVPGLLISAKMEGQFYILNNLPKVVFYQPFSFVFIFVELFIFRRQKHSDKTLPFLILSLLLAEVVLLNLELLGLAKFTSWHPTVLFLNPLLGTLLFFQLMSYLYKIESFKIIISAILLFILADRYYIFVNNFSYYTEANKEENSDFQEMIKYVKENTDSNSVFNISPFYENFYIEYRQMPNMFALLTNRAIVAQYLVVPSKATFLDSTLRELFAHTLFFNKLSLFDDCEKIINTKLKLETRLYSLPYRVNIQTRRMQCEYVNSLTTEQKENLKDGLIKRYKANFLVVEKKLFPEWDRVFPRYAWKSKNSYYVLVEL